MSLSKKTREKIFYWSILILPIIQVLIMYFYVNLNSFFLSFQAFNGKKYVFSGLKQYKILLDFFGTPAFHTYLKNSAVVWVIISFIPLIINVPIAITLFKRFHGSKFFRYMMVLPSLVPGMVSVIITRNLADGVVPELMLDLFGIKTSGLLVAQNTIMPTLIALHLIGCVGNACLVYIGCLCNVSVSSLEAARLDGVKAVQEFKVVYLPALWPILSLSLALTPTYFFTADLGLFSYFGEYADPQFWTIKHYTFVTILHGSDTVYPHLSAIGTLQTLIVVPIVMLSRKIMEKVGPHD